MSTVEIRGLDENRTIPRNALAALSGKLKGKLLEPAAPGYDEARAIWNGMIDRRPGLIVSCASADDVVAAVQFARDHELLVAVRGGGHNIAGNAVCDGGMQINLSALKSVQVDAKARTARVQPGATLADVDRETQKHGLAVPVGINSTTGIALGGGFGWTSRKYGLTVDSLIAADIVTADGSLRRIDAQNEPDLFWAIRGGGGNFGVVTTFEFRLHPVGPEVWSGLIVHPFDNARAVLRHYRDFCASAPDEVTAWVVLRQAPPLPFLPAHAHGKEVCIIAACFLGDADAGARALAALREYGSPIAEAIGQPHSRRGRPASMRC
jgi:FAD/FMN-containing dehydrogenase